MASEQNEPAGWGGRFALAKDGVETGTRAHPHQAALRREGKESDDPSVPAPWRSRRYLAARPGTRVIELGSVAAYDPGSNTARVRLLGAQANLIGPLPVAGSIAPALVVAGATCLVVLLDEDNPADAVLVAML